MQVNKINSSTSFGKVSLSTRALMNLSKEQIAMYHYVQDKLGNTPNKIHFDLSKNNELILAVFDMNNNIIQTFLGSTQKTLKQAVNCCKQLPKIPKDYGKHPVSFEKFLDSLY